MRACTHLCRKATCEATACDKRMDVVFTRLASVPRLDTLSLCVCTEHSTCNH